MTNSHQSISAESAVQAILEGWFGEAIEHMDDGKRVRRFLLEPLIKAVTSSDGEPSNGKQPLMASRPAPPVPSDHTPTAAPESGGLRWQTASEKDCCDALYQIGGALRRMGKIPQAQDAEKLANNLYPGAIKPAPIIPRTTT